jgi:uncharacterized RDD family membrane protein YckC
MDNTMNNCEENFGVIYRKKEYAGFLKRVVISLVDIIIISVVSACCLYITDFIFYSEDTYYNFNFFFTLAFCIFYLAILKRSKIRTVGYIITRVKIVDLKGQKPSIFKMILRVLLLFLGPFELFFDIIWLTSEATKQTLRDKYVGTYVINQHAVPIRKGKLQNVSLGFMGWNLMYREVQESQIK